MWRQAESDLERALAAASPTERSLLLVALGRLDEAEASLSGAAPGAVAEAALALARGEFLRALELHAEASSEGRRGRAMALGALGRTDAALAELEPLADPHSALLRAELHLEAGEAGPASAALPGALAPLDGACSSLLILAELRLELARAEIALASGALETALRSYRAARIRASPAGSPTLLARAWSRLGEAHARCGNRWRALRAVTHALDLTGAPGIDAPDVAGVHYRAWQVYSAFGHADLAERALRAGHHRVVQIATQIQVREYRESYFLDHRENRRLVAAWKGEASWGEDIPRG